MLRKLLPSLAILCLLDAAALAAPLTVAEPWVRGTVEGQDTTAGYMTITSDQDRKLVAVSADQAGAAAIHEMHVHDNHMMMHTVHDLALPAGKPVVLDEGGYHLMLMKLKHALKAGDKVTLTLTAEDAGGARQTLRVVAPVRALGGSMDMGGQDMKGHEMKGHDMGDHGDMMKHD